MNTCNIEDVTLSVNGQKVTGLLTDLNLFSDSLPPEVARLLMSQLNLADLQSKAETVADVKVKIAQTMSPEANNDPVKREIEAYMRAKKAEEAMVRTVPAYVQRAHEQADALDHLRNEKDPQKEFTIYESGVALGIVTGKSTREETDTIMKKYSRINFEVNDPDPIHFYSDISLYVFFDEENIVQELKFVNEYKGMTSKGLKLGDSIEKAIELYSQPKMKSPKGAVWDNFAVFCEQSLITSIRLQK